jgi:hypothetical protein
MGARHGDGGVDWGTVGREGEEEVVYLMEKERSNW